MLAGLLLWFAGTGWIVTSYASEGTSPEYRRGHADAMELCKLVSYRAVCATDASQPCCIGFAACDDGCKQAGYEGFGPTLDPCHAGCMVALEGCIVEQALQ